MAEINECDANPCQNDGTCFDLINDYACICKPGYTDVNCNTGQYIVLNIYIWLKYCI